MTTAYRGLFAGAYVANHDVVCLPRTSAVPVFAAMGMRDRALDYVESVRERFLNPYLDHRIADIAQNHVAKIQRRILPLVELARSLSLQSDQPRLRSLLSKRGFIAHPANDN